MEDLLRRLEFTVELRVLAVLHGPPDPDENRALREYLVAAGRRCWPMDDTGPQFFTRALECFVSGVPLEWLEEYSATQRPLGAQVAL